MNLEMSYSNREYHRRFDFSAALGQSINDPSICENPFADFKRVFSLLFINQFVKKGAIWIDCIVINLIVSQSTKINLCRICCNTKL
jgi:hypothetical protein